MDCGHVSRSRYDEHAVGGPGDRAELSSHDAWGIWREPAQRRDEAGQGELSSHPDGCRQDVEEEPDGVEADGQHVSALRRGPRSRPVSLQGAAETCRSPCPPTGRRLIRSLLEAGPSPVSYPM